ERTPDKREVDGSSPFRPIKKVWFPKGNQVFFMFGKKLLLYEDNIERNKPAQSARSVYEDTKRKK
ncbi:hypothetical protein, partial [Bacillus sp. USDA818B3_A]|uniref:hypothetical protein n=1 Tax=Bacillus sp. USDA818B3_A TaxID=2698834 RepID=UPI001F48A73C